jgi:hypothetical protein
MGVPGTLCLELCVTGIVPEPKGTELVFPEFPANRWLQFMPSVSLTCDSSGFSNCSSKISLEAYVTLATNETKILQFIPSNMAAIVLKDLFHVHGVACLCMKTVVSCTHMYVDLNALGNYKAIALWYYFLSSVKIPTVTMQNLPCFPAGR